MIDEHNSKPQVNCVFTVVYALQELLEVPAKRLAIKERQNEKPLQVIEEVTRSKNIFHLNPIDFLTYESTKAKRAKSLILARRN